MSVRGMELAVKTGKLQRRQGEPGECAAQKMDSVFPQILTTEPAQTSAATEELRSLISAFPNGPP